MELVQEIKTERKNFYDIIKALGIISIVIGHCHYRQAVVDFVYSYHLALFLFVAGLQFNIKKYSLRPSLFIQNRIKSMWPPFFGYLTFFTVTHDLAIQLQLLPEGRQYGDILASVRVVNNLIFLGDETLGGAMWFVPVMLVTMILFSIIVYISCSFFGKIRVFTIIFFSCMIGSLGVACNMYFIEMSLHIHTGLLLLPVLMAGFLLTYFRIDVSKFVRWYIAIPCLFFVCWSVIKNGHRIELAQELFGGSASWFYVITFCGLYFICFLSAMIDRIPLLSRCFAFLGRYTFDIMALHFFVFKLIDVCYGKCIGNAPEVYSAFPCAYRTLWPLYLITTIVICPWIRIGIDKLFASVKCFACRSNGTDI